MLNKDKITIRLLKILQATVPSFVIMEQKLELPLYCCQNPTDEKKFVSMSQ